MRRAHVGLLGGVLLLTALHRGGPDRWGFRLSWRALAACLGLGLCLVLPYAPHLLVEESWVQLRALQLAPLLFAGLVAVGHRVTARAPVLRLGGLVALGVMLTAYYRIARIDTRDYVRNYAGDRAVLRDLEAYAAAHRTDRVYLARGILAAWQWNPYRLKYVNYCNHYSFFKTPWTKDNFVRRHSRLRPLGDDEPALAARAEEQARRLPPRLGVQFFLIDGSNVVGVYTP